MHRRSACDPALESSRQRRQGELSQASIDVVHVEILMVKKTPGGLVLRLGFNVVLQRIVGTDAKEHVAVPAAFCNALAAARLTNSTSKLRQSHQSEK